MTTKSEEAAAKSSSSPKRRISQRFIQLCSVKYNILLKGFGCGYHLSALQVGNDPNFVYQTLNKGFITWFI